MCTCTFTHSLTHSLTRLQCSDCSHTCSPQSARPYVISLLYATVRTRAPVMVLQTLAYFLRIPRTMQVIFSIIGGALLGVTDNVVSITSDDIQALDYTDCRQLDGRSRAALIRPTCRARAHQWPPCACPPSQLDS